MAGVLKKTAGLAAVLVVTFILRIIYLADTGWDSIFFKLVKSTPYGDKVGRFFIFGGLTLVSNLATKLKTYSVAKLPVYVGTLLVIAFAVLEELSQEFFPTRTFDFKDLAADGLGILACSYLTYLADSEGANVKGVASLLGSCWFRGPRQNSRPARPATLPSKACL